MTGYTTDRLPTAADADPFGQVRWSPHHPGMLCPWQDVRPGEAWTHSSAWKAVAGAEAPSHHGTNNAPATGTPLPAAGVSLPEVESPAAEQQGGNPPSEDANFP